MKDSATIKKQLAANQIQIRVLNNLAKVFLARLSKRLSELPSEQTITDLVCIAWAAQIKKIKARLRLLQKQNKELSLELARFQTPKLFCAAAELTERMRCKIGAFNRT